MADLESFLSNSKVLLLIILKELKTIKELWYEFLKVASVIETRVPNGVDVKEKAVCVVKSSVL